MTVTLSLWSERALIFVDGDLPTDAREQCVESCRYEQEGHEYSDAWQRGDWNGYVELFRQNSGGQWFFPIGLLTKVTRILDLHGVTYEIDGLRRPGRGAVDYGWHADFDLREYQQDAVTDALDAGSGILSLPTGAGKTVIGLRLIHELQHPALVVMHQTEIAEQWCDRIESQLGVTPDRVFGGDFETGGDIAVGLYQSLYQDGELRDHPALEYPVAVFDECHRVGADLFSEIALASAACYRYGLSATPMRSDSAGLKVIGGTGELICDIDVETLIKQGYLAEPEWRLLDPPRVDGRYRNWQAEYKAAIVTNDARNDMLTTEIEDVPKPCLVTVEQINHGERLLSLLQDRGVDAEFIHGSASDRDAHVQAFRDGDLPVLVATVGIVGEGFDVPEIESFVVAGGKKSRTSLIQQVGRALRPDSEHAVIVDVMDSGTGGYNSWVGEHAEKRYRLYSDYYKSYGPR